MEEDTILADVLNKNTKFVTSALFPMEDKKECLLLAK